MLKTENLLSGMVLGAVMMLVGSSCVQAQSDSENSRSMQVNMQAHANVSELMYGRASSLVHNLPLFTFTLEGAGSDNIGSTFFFADMEVGNANVPDNKMLAGVYAEFSREWNFWSHSKASALSIHTEWDAGVGYGGDSWGSTACGFEFKTALLGGLSYVWSSHAWWVQLQMLARYEVRDYDGIGGQGWQLTLAWSYTPVRWFTLAGYMDMWQNPIAAKGKHGMQSVSSLHVACEPYVWFHITDYLWAGSRLRFTWNNYQHVLPDGSYGYDKKAYIAPTIALRWNMN